MHLGPNQSGSAGGMHYHRRPDNQARLAFVYLPVRRFCLSVHYSHSLIGYHFIVLSGKGRINAAAAGPSQSLPRTV